MFASRCSNGQLGRLDEAESMFRGAIDNRPGYGLAMTSLGMNLDTQNQVRRRALSTHNDGGILAAGSMSRIF